MIFRSTLILALILMLAVPAVTDPQIPAPAGNPITLSSSSATRLVPNPSTAQILSCNSIFIQAMPSNTGVIYILNAPVNITMAYQGAGTTLVAILGAPASSTATPASFSMPSNGTATSQAGGLDMRLWGVQGSVNSDQAIATCDARN